MSCYAALSIESFNSHHSFLMLRKNQLHSLVLAQRHNARIDPPGRICASDKFTMKGTLIPVGSNELFGGPFDVSLHRWLCFCSRL